MGRAPCCDKTKVKRGPWSPEEDHILRTYLHKHGTGGNWISLPHKAGLKRCGKSCRLRWLNYLRPDIKHGGFTEEEDHVILSLYHNIGSRWSVIASQLPGRTDNDVKNYWNTKLKKKLLASAVETLSATTAMAAKPYDMGPTTTILSQHYSVNAASQELSGNSLPYYYYHYPMENFQPNMVHETAIFPLPGLMDLPENGENQFTSLPLKQEVPSNEAVGEDNSGFMSDFGYGFYYDNFLDGFDFEEKVSPSSVDVSYIDQTFHGLYHDVAN